MSLLCILTAGQTPYRVSVRAGTSQGFGGATSIVVFSNEGGEFILSLQLFLLYSNIMCSVLYNVCLIKMIYIIYNK